MIKPSVSQKRSSYPQRMSGLCSKILWDCAVIHPQGLPMLQTAPYLPLTFQAAVDLLDHVAQVTEQLAQQCEPAAESSLVVDTAQRQQLLRSLNMWVRVGHQNEE